MPFAVASMPALAAANFEPEGVALGGGEEAEDLPVYTEVKRGHEHEQHRVVARLTENKQSGGAPAKNAIAIVFSRYDLVG